MTPSVHIIAIETGLQPHVIRIAAEHWGAMATVTWVGNSAQVVDYLLGDATADVIVLAAHGDERGMLLPELADEFKPLYPYDTVIRPVDFAEFLRLRGNLILNLGCIGGTPEMAAAFLKHGANVYIGATDYPDGAASTKYAIDFLYAFLCRRMGLEEAHQTASDHDDDRRMFRLYRNTTSPQV
jgi:hypothetical protein